MKENHTQETTLKHWAFISYRHADNKEQDRGWASWLHKEIEHYEVPAELVGTKNKRGDIIPERIYPVFRDEESLPADADLANSISSALDRSRFLVVVCSPRAVESQYVAQEIEHFKETGKGDRIIGAIIAGEPGNETLECFPEPLREIVRPDGKLMEPIAADFRLSNSKEGYTSSEAYKRELLKSVPKKQAIKQAEAYDERLQLMKLKIIAGILGVGIETLRDRDKLYQLAKQKKRSKQLRIWLGAVSIIGIFAICAGYIAWKKQLIAEKQTELLLIEQEKVSTKSAEQEKLLWKASYADLVAGISAEESGNQREALTYLARSLEYMPKNKIVVKKAITSLECNTSTYKVRQKFNIKDVINSLDYSPNSSFIAIGSNNNKIQVFNTNSGILHWKYLFSDSVDRVIYSDDGNHLAVTSDRNLCIFNSRNGQITWQHQFESSIEEITFDSIGKYIAIGTYGLLSVFDKSSGEILWKKLFSNSLCSISFSPDNSTIAVGSYDKYLRLFSTHTGNEIWKYYFGGFVTRVLFSPDGDSIVAGSWNKSLRMFKAISGKNVWHTQLDSSIDSLIYSPDSSQITAGTSGGGLHVLDSNSGKHFWQRYFKSFVWCVTYSPDGTRIAAGSNDQNLHVFTRHSGEKLWSFSFGDSVNCVEFSPDGMQLTAGSSDGSVLVFEAGYGKELMLYDFDYPLSNSVYSNNNQYLAIVAPLDNSLQVITTKTWEFIWKKRLEKRISNIKISSNNKFIGLSSDKTLYFYYLESGRAGIKIKFTDNINEFIFLRENTQVAVASSNSLQLYDLHSGRQLWKIVYSDMITQLAGAPDAKYIAIGSIEGRLRVIELITGKKIWDFNFKNNVTALAISSDSKYLTASSLDASLTAFHIKTGKIRWSDNLEDIPNTLVFSPNNKNLAIHSGQSQLRLVESTTKKLIWTSAFNCGRQPPIFSSDGDFVIVKATDNSIRILETGIGGEVFQHKFTSEIKQFIYSPEKHLLTVRCGDHSLYLFDLKYLFITYYIDTFTLIKALKFISQTKFHYYGRILDNPTDMALLNKVTPLISSQKNSAFSIYLEWLNMPYLTKKISPYSSVFLRNHISERLRVAKTKGIIYFIHARAPWHPLCPVSLARLPRNKNNTLRKKFLSNLTLKRLKKANIEIWGKEHIATDADYAAKWMRELGYSELAKEAEKFRENLLAK